VIEEAARGLELRAAERGIRITLALPPALPDVQADHDELAQVFQNLLDNAVKYGRRDSEVVVSGGTEANRLMSRLPIKGTELPGSTCRV
jgi:two-component system phosphate regulon sensor histidine kinase PhoR